MAKNSEASPTYRHYCKVLGPETVLPRALVADATNTYVLYYQNKCPFCGTVAVGTKKYAKGVTPDTLGGYYLDEKIAEKLQ